MIAGSNLRQGTLRNCYFLFSRGLPWNASWVAVFAHHQTEIWPRNLCSQKSLARNLHPYTHRYNVNGWASWTASSKATNVEMKTCLLCRARCNSFCWSLGGTSTGRIKRLWAMHWWKTSHNFLQCLHSKKQPRESKWVIIFTWGHEN